MAFENLSAYLDSLREKGVPGCDLIVKQDHREIYRHTAGFRDAEGVQPVRMDDLYWLFSCTKVLTTCAAMQLIGQGKLHLDDPVAKYLPAYGHLTVREGDRVRPAARVMTVRHLMSMQSGLSYNLELPAVQRVIRETGGRAGTRELAEAFAEEPLCFDPGEDFQYSLSHDALAAVIEAVSGLRFSAYLRQNILDPLGLRDFSFTLTEDRLPRLAAIWMREGDQNVLCAPDSNNYHLTPDFESGGAGLMGSAEDYAAFLDAIACGGQGENGAPILAPEMIQLWSANQLGPKSRQSFDTWHRLGYSYALGVRTRVDLSLGGPGSIGEFGWDGAAGSWGMIDPQKRLSAFFAMHVRNFGYSYDVIHPTIRGLIYEGLNKNT